MCLSLPTKPQKGLENATHRSYRVIPSETRGVGWAGAGAGVEGGGYAHSLPL